jgi:hypothetical protein
MTSALAQRIRTILGIVLLTALLVSLVPTQLVQGAAPPYKVFLPFISKPFVGISGQVTLNGSAAAGELIWLCYKVDNPTLHYDCMHNTQTNSNGYYFFDVSILTPGYVYDITFNNVGNPYTGRLLLWVSRTLDPYPTNASIVMETFDISDVILTAPDLGTTISLPHDFQWSPRSYSSTDSYALLLINSTFRFDAPLQGFVSSYTLNSLPAGFSLNTEYKWAVKIVSPDGGYGQSYYRRTITFSNSGSSLFISSPPKMVSGDVYKYYLANGSTYTR